MVAFAASLLAVPVGRSARVALPIALVLLLPSPGLAQPLRSFQDLALRVNLGDRLRIEDQSGARTTGRLTRLTRDEITITDEMDRTRPLAPAGRALVRFLILGTTECRHS